ncbi:MAG: hypothetical protein ACRDIY_20445, partial [Chloroflexota bacterium]
MIAKWRSLAPLAGLAVAALVLGASTASAQGGDSGWSAPVLLARYPYTSQNQIGDTAITTDQAGGVHVFWRLDRPPAKSGGPAQRLIEYTRSTGGKWSPPTDVVAADQGINSPTAAVDRYGNVHLFWYGGDEYG